MHLPLFLFLLVLFSVDLDFVTVIKGNFDEC